MSKLKVLILAGLSAVAMLFPAGDSLAATTPTPTPHPCHTGFHRVGTKCVKNRQRRVKHRRTCAKGFHRSAIPPHRCVRNRPHPKPKPRPHPKPKPRPHPKPTHTPTPAPTHTPMPRPTHSPAPKPTHSPTPKPTHTP
jgi:hypothetical protein